MMNYNITSSTLLILFALILQPIIFKTAAIAESNSLQNYSSFSNAFVSENSIVEKLEGLNDQLSILDKHIQSRLESK